MRTRHANAAACARSWGDTWRISRRTRVSQALGKAEAVHVIEETHGFYKNLIAGKVDGGKLWLK